MSLTSSQDDADDQKAQARGVVKAQRRPNAATNAAHTSATRANWHNVAQTRDTPLDRHSRKVVPQGAPLSVARNIGAAPPAPVT